jgi:Phage integrase family
MACVHSAAAVVSSFPLAGREWRSTGRVKAPVPFSLSGFATFGKIAWIAIRVCVGAGRAAIGAGLLTNHRACSLGGRSGHQRPRPHAAAACDYKLANDGADTRALQAHLGHRNIQNTTRYTALAPGRFKGSFGTDA